MKTSSPPSERAVTEREAYLILNMLSGIGPVRLAALLEFVDSVEEIFNLSETELARIPGISESLAHKLNHWADHVDLEKELRLIERGGVTVLIRSDEAYPQPLREIHDSPICLYVRGTIPPETATHAIAMVGTRHISHYGEQMARHLAESAAYAKWVVVSGLAVGIDTVVHRSTVNAGGKTIAVLGSGLARLHPQENLQLARDIIATGGAVISEFPMTMSPTRHTFPMRNRIISGLSQGTVVVEAGLNSGSLITAAQAIEQGRRVFAVPGNVDTGAAGGCNTLIRKGAVLVESFDHILEEFDFLPGFDSLRSVSVLREESAPGVIPEVPAGFDDQPDEIHLGPAADAVLQILKKGDLSLDSMAAQTGYPAQELLSATIALEIMCRIKRNTDGSYRRIR